jgi:hypothetical protein
VLYDGPAQGSAGSRLRMRYTVSKASCVTAEVKDATGAGVFRDRRKVAKGAHTLTWTPDTAGTYTLTIEAVDQNQNTTSPDFTIVIG